MCGIAGLLTFQPFADGAEARSRVKTMTRSIAHRGPDAMGFWLDETFGVAMGHRRLSILDLSPSGAQPMLSACGRYVVVYNGEIYNHLAIRETLEKDAADRVWKGHSDTETLLVAISEWGLERTLQSVFGMFAFALWDREERVLSLARDRMGEKPLYFAPQGRGWMFGSELRVLLAAGLKPNIHHASVAAYLRFGYVPDHLCILKDVQKVIPGSIIRLREGAEPEQLRYASVEAQFGRPTGLSDPEEAAERLEEVLQEVVQDQMISDVPLGCFLSGGVDSSLTASLMQARSARQVQTYSIGFEDPRFDETPQARAVAQHLGTDHAEFILKEDDTLAIVEDLPQIYDEPFADSSQIPTILLCRCIREHVTVALTGDGGDEVFGGYNRHVRGPGLWEKIARLPGYARTVGAGIADSAAYLGSRNERVSRCAASAFGFPLTTIENLPKLADALRSADTAEEFYLSFISGRHDMHGVLVDGSLATPDDPRKISPSGLEMAAWMMARDTTGYLPGDILVKVDRAAMSVGLETRAPFLDARVFDLARQIPIGLHVDNRQGKLLLRQVRYKYVPQSLIERPKQGFAMPIDGWLRGALRSWGDELIGDKQLFKALGLYSEFTCKLWKRHLDRRVNAGKELWTILILLQWARRMDIGQTTQLEAPGHSAEFASGASH